MTQVRFRSGRHRSFFRRSHVPRLVGSMLPLAAVVTTCPSSAQTSSTAPVVVGGLALQQLEPSPAGDALFGVASPSIGGHLVPRAVVMFDYARNPLQVFGDTEATLVSSQGFLRVDASLPLWDRVLVSLDMPLAILQAGDDPGTPGISYNVPSSAALGDLRLGARVRLLGAERAPLQASFGAYAFIPTGPSGSYSGEGAVRGAPHLIIGGVLQGPVGLVWSATTGAVLRASDNPHTLTFGTGAAAVLADERLRLGPELYGSLPLGGQPMLSVSHADVAARARVNVELLLGARYRLFDVLELGAAGGPGLSQAIGTPTFRLVALAAWSPASPNPTPPAPRPADRDGDGIPDKADACPTTRGVVSDNPALNGCPSADRDGDGVLDLSDACPTTPGPSSLDLTKNGCPPDRDGDGIADAADACPDVYGSSSPVRDQNGCPSDQDGDGVLDRVDACLLVKGEASADRTRNGCPEDIDGDGLKPPEDACPREKGARDPDPRQSGCPRGVRLYEREIVLLQPIRFIMYGRERHETAEPVPDEVLINVRDVLAQHPEITRVEVQGHADDEGDPEFNARIAQERAESVRFWLIQAGIPKEKLVAKGYSDKAPLASNRTLDGRQKNRRVQIFVLEEP
jgi:OmpA-OmpF porin, OOP family